MASGNTLLVLLPQQHIPPSSNYATLDLRNQHPVLDFDKATIESALFEDVMPRAYAGGGITCRICFSATTVTTGDVVWGISLERHQDETGDLDSDDFAAERTVTATVPGTSGMVQYAEIAFTEGAQMDSIALGEHFRLKIRRVATDAADTADNDAELWSIEVRET